MAKQAKKTKRRLASRIKEWEDMHADGVAHHGKVKIVHGYAYRKPGSLRK